MDACRFSHVLFPIAPPPGPEGRSFEVGKRDLGQHVWPTARHDGTGACEHVQDALLSGWASRALG